MTVTLENSFSPCAQLARKIRRKFLIRRIFGELYVGKRMKMHYLRRILPTLGLPAEAQILEAGSEDGAFTDYLSRAFPRATVTGMELRTDWAEACSQWAFDAGRTPRLSFRQGDILQMEDRARFDAIFCLDVLGYIADDRAAVKNLARALVPGGLMVVHQPNPFYRHADGRVEYVPPEQAGRITNGHLRHGYTPEEMRALLEEADLSVERILPLHGRYSDLAHHLYHRLERPAPLRLISLPLVDLLWRIDARRPPTHGNTVLAIARRAA